MKFDSFIDDNHHEINRYLNGIGEPMELTKGLHVIGTCSDCKDALFVETGHKNFGLENSYLCGSIDSERDGEAVSDGCIHFEKSKK